MNFSYRMLLAFRVNSDSGRRPSAWQRLVPGLDSFRCVGFRCQHRESRRSMAAMSTMVQRIAQWALAFDHAALSPRAVELIKYSVLDSLGCAILTLDEDCVSGVLDFVRSMGGSAQASLIRGGTKLPVTLATLANATLIRAIDFNDHLALNPNSGGKLGGHPSDNFAAIMAIAEWRNLG